MTRSSMSQSPHSLEPSPFILRLPKAELHLHLEGSVEPGTLVEISQSNPQPLTLEKAERLYQYTDFTGFLMAFKTVTEYLRTPGDFEIIAYRLMQQLARQNVWHAEVIISVGVMLWRKLNVDAIFEGMERGRERGERDFGVSVLWIFDAVRHFGAERARQVFEKAVQFRKRNVAAVGIGGDERRAGPDLFRAVYEYAAGEGLHLTAHAGETIGPESIWGVLNLKAERIGHGLSAGQDRGLMAELAERQIPIEVCITSNLATGCCLKVEDHPIKRFFDEGLMITLNSDDPAMFHTTLVGEYALAQQAFGFSDEQLREIARNAFEASFLPAEKKLELLNRFDRAGV
jgi:aminodeoxyfutalosine deaminase